MHITSSMVKCPISILVVALLVAGCTNARFQRRRRIQSRLKPLIPQQSRQDDGDGTLGSSSSSGYNMDNLTCQFFEQPLNHFDLPRNASGTYWQRYCTTEMFVSNISTAPIFFYTGNESPLEEYVEHSGLLWEMAREMKAQVVFAEHRYEGQSLPFTHSSSNHDDNSSMPRCMAYSSSVQAITDYARLIRNVLWKKHGGGRRRPVICFGGSYGGMLSAWMRMRYPSYVAGSIAGSAPIWGFPQTQNNGLDAAYAVIRHGLMQPYPPNASVSIENFCPDNLQALFPLIHVVGSDAAGRDFLTRSFDLCEPLLDTTDLLAWLQSPWFDLAEGSFPYPSSYIPFALTHLNVTLPAWPLQAACWTTGLAKSYGVEIRGSKSTVNYTITIPSSSPGGDMKQNGPDTTTSASSALYAIHVDWEQAHSLTPPVDWIQAPAVSNLMHTLKQAVAIWYNMTHKETCFDISRAAPNMENGDGNPDMHSKQVSQERSLRSSMHLFEGATMAQKEGSTSNMAFDSCQKRIQSGSWPALCCNEDMNLIITYAQGVGKDIFWPPSVPRYVKSYQDFVDYYSENQDPYCADPNDIFGFPRQADPWSNWLDLQYDNSNVWETTSNIVFSNGLLDPWSAAGVYLDDADGKNSHRIMEGLTLQKGKNGMAALLLDYGGHHVDLMTGDSVHDPPSFDAARQIERQYVESWIQEFWTDAKHTYKLQH